MTDLKGIIFMSGKKSNFKFQIGDLVVPTVAKEMGPDKGPSKVTGLQLNGYVIIEPIGTACRLLVEAKDYEKFEGEVGELNDQNTPIPSWWGTAPLLSQK